jgi:deoxyribose-phosphate aldolase
MTLNKMIDHTKLGIQVTFKDMDVLVEEGLKYNFKSLCINPPFVKYVSEKLKTSDVLTCTVVGFPHGTHTTEVKVFETKQAILDGADEIDMVVSNYQVTSKDEKSLTHDIREVVKAASGKTVKVILETCYLTDDEIEFACNCAKQAGAHFVKTSTGFGASGATVEHVKLMKDTVKNDMEVKASGGIRTYEDAMKMVEAGATRLGTSKGVDIMLKEVQHGDSTY